MSPREHGGNLDWIATRSGTTRDQWADLSTGINPMPFPVPPLPADAWTALPDASARDRLIAAARRFWEVPEEASVLPVPGCSAAIAQLPWLFTPGKVAIPEPTYNEHAASFRAAGWQVEGTPDAKAPARVIVHPNNPDGRLHLQPQGQPLVIDESFCDVTPEATLIHRAADLDTVVLKSFGKFWGLAGLRLGFVIARPEFCARLDTRLGPWAVSGPALAIGTAALEDHAWAETTRLRLARDAERLDALVTRVGATLVGGTSLFRLYDCDAAAMQDHLARHRIWSRTFSYNPRWLRLGLPGDAHWARVEAAFA